MKKTVLAFALAALLLPLHLQAQVGVAARVGSIGIGVEAAAALSPRIAVRGGVGLIPVEPSITIDDIDWTLDLPSWYSIGLDVYLAGPLRIGGGMLFRGGDPSISAEPQTSIDVGGRMFTPAEIGTLTASIDSQGNAPYLILGFGNHTSMGFGLFLDVGVALLGDPEFSLTNEGGNFPDQAELNSRLNQQAQELQDDAGSYLNYWPFLNVGVKLGIG